MRTAPVTGELGELRRLALEGYTVREILKRTERSRFWVENNLKRMGLFHLVRVITPWTETDLEVLRARYPHEKTAGIAKDMGREQSSVHAMASKLGINKTPEYLASPDACRLRREDSPGIAHRFKPGQEPANKGLRRPGWSPGRMSETQFKKGQRGSTFVPIGTERVNCDGYRDRKIAATGRTNLDWRAVHRLLWEEVNGPVPAGHLVAFVNQDKSDLRIENLEMVSRVEWMRRNTIHTRYPKELVQVIQLTGALKRKINNRSKA